MADGITAVRVRCEVKKALGWKTNTEIACENLRHSYREPISPGREDDQT